MRSRLAKAALLYAASMLSAGPSAADAPIVVGIFPYRAAAELHRRFDPLADHLTGRLGRPVHVEVLPSYASAIEQVGEGTVDVGLLGPSPYVQLVDQYGPKRLLARFEVNGRATFQGYIVARDDSPIGRLEDLAGRSFAFGDPESATGYIAPQAMLVRAGVPLDRLARYEFLANHDNVVLGVLVGAFDAGAVKEEVYLSYRTLGLKVLATSAPLSEPVFVAADHLPEGDVTALRDALLGLDSPTLLSGLMAGATRLIPAVDADYDSMRELLAAVPEGPHAQP